MADYQRLIIEGNLGAEPELRTTKGGTSVVNLSVAVHRDQWENGQRTGNSRTIWHSVSLFGSKAEYAARYGKEGRRVLIEAEDVEPDLYQPDGKPATVKLKAKGTTIKFLDRRENEEASQEELDA